MQVVRGFEDWEYYRFLRWQDKPQSQTLLTKYSVASLLQKSTIIIFIMCYYAAARGNSSKYAPYEGKYEGKRKKHRP